MDKELDERMWQHLLTVIRQDCGEAGVPVGDAFLVWRGGLGAALASNEAMENRADFEADAMRDPAVPVP